MVPKNPNDSSITRRTLIGAGAGLAVAHAAAPARAQATPDANLPPAAPQWQKQSGAEVMSPPYGLPSPFEAKVVRRLRGGIEPATRLSTPHFAPLPDLDCRTP